jgi:hypothetical protein
MSIPEVFVSVARKWHGSIGEKFSCIDNLVTHIVDRQSEWSIPKDLIDQLTDNRSRLEKLIYRCRTIEASPADRQLRNTLLKSASDLCLVRVKQLAYGRHAEGVMTTEDVHMLGFLMPGENGGRHKRKEPVNVPAYVKVTVINEDFIRVVIDQSEGHNAALTAHGWPRGVRNALIVIVAADGKTEVYRRITTRMHSSIHMPVGSHGRQFILRAAFLRHADDDPLFGNEHTFSMPLTTEDLAAGIMVGNHRQEEIDSYIQEIERLRSEVDRLKAEPGCKK